jgi:hypothetical protein
MYTVGNARFTNTIEQEIVSNILPGWSPTEQYMNSRISFFSAATVALVLVFAAPQSHATERRDPVLPLEPVGGPTHVMSPAQALWQNRSDKRTPRTSGNAQKSNQHSKTKDKPTARKTSGDGQTSTNNASN